MIYFFSDNHYDAHPGKQIFKALPVELKEQISFFEDDWSVLENQSWEDECNLLILNMIGDTCGVSYPEKGLEHVERYIKNGGNVLLLHGSSAAFWKSSWWRKLVGFRWVRPNDPDGVVPSTHPIVPFEVKTIREAKHPLALVLNDFSLPADEVYINLEQNREGIVLMETTIAEGTFPQCMIVPTEFGGELVHFLPGHKYASASGCMATITEMVKYYISKH